MRHLWENKLWKYFAECPVLIYVKYCHLHHLWGRKVCSSRWNGSFNKELSHQGAGGQPGHETPLPSSFKDDSECFSVCALTPLSHVLKAIEDVAINGVLATYFQSINVDIGRCTAVGDMSIWTSCFPPLDEQHFLGDKRKRHVFYINAVDIIVWTTFNSDGVCVSSWERILFKCWHLKTKVGENPREGDHEDFSATAVPPGPGGLQPRLSTFSHGPGSLAYPFPIPLQTPHTSFWYHTFWGGGVGWRKGTWIF